MPCYFYQYQPKLKLSTAKKHEFLVYHDNVDHPLQVIAYTNKLERLIRIELYASNDFTALNHLQRSLCVLSRLDHLIDKLNELKFWEEDAESES